MCQHCACDHSHWTCPNNKGRRSLWSCILKVQLRFLLTLKPDTLQLFELICIECVKALGCKLSLVRLDFIFTAEPLLNLLATILWIYNLGIRLKNIVIFEDRSLESGGLFEVMGKTVVLVAFGEKGTKRAVYYEVG